MIPQVVKAIAMKPQYAKAIMIILRVTKVIALKPWYSKAIVIILQVARVTAMIPWVTKVIAMTLQVTRAIARMLQVASVTAVIPQCEKITCNSNGNMQKQWQGIRELWQQSRWYHKSQRQLQVWLLKSQQAIAIIPCIVNKTTTMMLWHLKRQSWWYCMFQDNDCKVCCCDPHKSDHKATMPWIALAITMHSHHDMLLATFALWIVIWKGAIAKEVHKLQSNCERGAGRCNNNSHGKHVSCNITCIPISNSTTTW